MIRTVSTSIAIALALVRPSSSSAETALPSHPAIPPKTSSLHDAAVLLGQQYDTYYRLKDSVGMATLYAPDGELVSPTGKLIRGREALVDYYRRRFASDATRHKIVVIETHALGEAGYSVSNFSVQAPVVGLAETRLEEGHIAAVYTHDETGWHFALVEPSLSPPKTGMIPLRHTSPAKEG